MRVFITGATGMIGTRLIRQLREQEHDVVGMTRPIGQFGYEARRLARRISIPTQRQLTLLWEAGWH